MDITAMDEYEKRCAKCGNRLNDLSDLLESDDDASEEPLPKNRIPLSLLMRLTDFTMDKTEEEAAAFHEKLEEFLQAAGESPSGRTDCISPRSVSSPYKIPDPLASMSLAAQFTYKEKMRNLSAEDRAALEETEEILREKAKPSWNGFRFNVDVSPEDPELEFHHPDYEHVGNRKQDLLFTDLTPYLEKTFQLEVPTVAEAFPGKCLFYSGRRNAVQGDTGVGKTIFLMKACIAVLNAGGTLLYIDTEDLPEGFVSRMLSLGADPQAIKERLMYLQDPTPEKIRRAQVWAKSAQPVLVVLDGLAESLASMEFDENSAHDFLSYYRENLHPFAKEGAAVVIADHVSKKTKNRGPHARGTSAKVGSYDGVVYEILTGKPFSPTQSGHIKLRIAKDRNGGAGARGEIVAELHLTPGTDGRTITTFKHPKANDSKKEPMPSVGTVDLTPYKDRITKFLLDKPYAKTSEILQLGGKGENLSNALKEMVGQTVAVRKEGKKHLHFLKSVPEQVGLIPSEIVSPDIEGNLQPFPEISR